MKNSIILLIFSLFVNFGFAQTRQDLPETINVFDSKGYKHKFFVASNSGINDTPIGIRVGILGKTGLYLGTRFGKGKIYNSDSDLKTINSNLFVVSAGIIKPLYVKNDFSLHMLLGGGYGQLKKFRWERWSKDGFELESGLMTSYKRLILNLSGNMFSGFKTYPSWDFTAGLGYRF